MVKKYMFVTDSNGRSHEVKVDLKNIDRQAREHRAAGRSVTVMDEDERIRMGFLANQLRRASNQ